MNKDLTKILCIETSTEICSVILTEAGKIIDQLEDFSGMNHSKKLTQFIDDILKRNQLKAADLSAVAVSEGPGSYTGLRIGVSAAKGICFAVNKPLIAISPLKAMAHHVIQASTNLGFTPVIGDLLVPMIDARRMEVYRAIFNSRLETIREAEAVIVDEQTLDAELEHSRLLFFGNGAAKCKSVVHHPNALFIDGIITSAINLAALAQTKFELKEFADLAYFEPHYLKEFLAIKSNKNIFGLPS